MFSSLNFQFWLLAIFNNKIRAQKVCVGVRPEGKMKSPFVIKDSWKAWMGDWANPFYRSLTMPLMAIDHHCLSMWGNYTYTCMQTYVCIWNRNDFFSIDFRRRKKDQYFLHLLVQVCFVLVISGVDYVSSHETVFNNLENVIRCNSKCQQGIK